MIKINKSSLKTYKFGDIASNISERAEPKETRLGIYVGLEHLDPDCIHIKRRGHPSDVKGTKLRVYPGDIIFGKRRAYQRKAGIVDFDGICSAHAMVVRANPKVILPELLPFFMHSDAFMHRAVDVSEGSLSPTIKWKILAEQKFRIPSPDDQKRIADLLWSIDELQEKYLKTYHAMDVLMKGYAKEMASNTSYPMMKIGDVATVTSGNSAPQGSNYFNGDKPFVRVQHFSEVDLTVNQHDLINDKAISDYRLKLFPKDSIVFTKSGASAYLEKKAKLKKPSYVVSHLGVIIADQSQIMPDYLFYIFRGLNISKNCVSDYPTIDLADIKRWEIPVPDMDIQNSLVDRFNAIIANYDKVKAVQHSLFEVKKQIINQVFEA